MTDRESIETLGKDLAKSRETIGRLTCERDIAVADAASLADCCKALTSERDTLRAQVARLIDERDEAIAKLAIEEESYQACTIEKDNMVLRLADEVLRSNEARDSALATLAEVQAAHDELITSSAGQIAGLMARLRDAEWRLDNLLRVGRRWCANPPDDVPRQDEQEVRDAVAALHGWTRTTEREP